MGIARRLFWVLSVLPLVGIWSVEMMTRWIVTGEDGPAMPLDPWMNKARGRIVGKKRREMR